LVLIRTAVYTLSSSNFVTSDLSREQEKVVYLSCSEKEVS
jgi:hypothetical protein